MHLAYSCMSDYLLARIVHQFGLADRMLYLLGGAVREARGILYQMSVRK